MTRAAQLAQAAAGGVLQVVSARNGDYYSTTSTSWVDIPGLSVTITPASSSSKFLIQLSFGRATTGGGNLDITAMVRVTRNGSDDVGINGNVSGSRWRSALTINGVSYNGDHALGGFSNSGLDSPSTVTPLTYKVQVATQASTFTMNASPNNANTGSHYHTRTQSSLTVMEIAG